MKKQSRYNRKGNSKKERVIMIASSAFVLAALTMTGVYVKNSSDKTKNDGYNIDFDSLESKANDGYEEIQNQIAEEFTAENEYPEVLDSDLDYLPMEQVDGGSVEIPGLTMPITNGVTGPNAVKLDELEEILNGRDLEAAEGLVEEALGAKAEQSMETSETEQAAVVEKPKQEVTKQSEPDFLPGDKLVWPVSGSVLIPYSMDKTVYFSTLQQYKCNPALVISAAEGDTISAAAAGTVTEVFYDEEIGNAVTMDIGNGYAITYGQLRDTTVEEGDYVKRGNLLGYVAAPTKYYSVEGTNVYFALTLEGKPADPMGEME